MAFDIILDCCTLFRQHSAVFLSRSVPVSYTHLDVYKRQLKKIEAWRYGKMRDDTAMQMSVRTVLPCLVCPALLPTLRLDGNCLLYTSTMGAVKEYFYENMPSISNPLGLGHKAMPLACKVQNLLIADFLHYLALRHGVFLSTMVGDVRCV